MNSNERAHERSAAPGHVSPAPPGPVVMDAPAPGGDLRYRRLFNAVHEGILVLDSDTGRITDANARIEDLLGWPRSEVLGKELWEIGLFETAARCHETLTPVRTGGAVTGLRLRVVYENGQFRDFAFAAARVNDAGHACIECHIHDVTEQRLGEEAQIQLAAILDSSLDAIITQDLNGIVTGWNRGAEQLFGYAADEMIGEPLLAILPEERVEEEREIHERLRRGEAIDHDETDRLTKSGQRVHLSRALSSLRDAAGTVIGTCEITRDITERVEVIRQLASARDAAEAANNAKDQFLAALSHELRTPLTPVLLTAAAMESDETIAEELREQFAMIRRSVELEAKLIDDLLDLTRITQGKLALQLANIDAHAVLQQSIDMLRKDFEAHQLELVPELNAAIHWVNADAVRLQQVFWNILRNALKFTPPGGQVNIRTWKDGNYLHVEIADTGLGITEEELPRIFDMFSQGTEAAEPRFGGLGLGLSISAVIIREHQGHIWAESRGRNQGATFHVQLPLALTSKSGRVKLPPPPIKPQPLRILLVEDHQASRDTLARLLSRRGHTVSMAGTLAEARAQAARSQFDLVISDLGLPDGTGHELMRSLVAEYGLPGIALSGFGMADDIQQSREAGFNEHLTKPVDITSLERAMLRVMEGRHPQAQSKVG